MLGSKVVSDRRKAWEERLRRKERCLGSEVEEEEKKKVICLGRQNTSKTDVREFPNRNLAIEITAPDDYTVMRYRKKTMIPHTADPARIPRFSAV